ncbi:unnamed protein product [Owenia fusiformis]|uniref:Uncharacterized protein n=1 Tax=Owenia fusiformis TaxID=6347 RepID=A0A8J1U7W0_OWEFU|nr:unnamed protein product [Owenia fusiformis]
MFSVGSVPPQQLLLPASQLVSILNTVRNLSVPKKQHKKDTTRTLENEEISNERIHKALGLEGLPRDLKLEDYCPIRAIIHSVAPNTSPNRSHSHVSANTFFENTNGFPVEDLYVNPVAPSWLTSQLLQRHTPPAVLVQKRHFQQRKKRGMGQEEEDNSFSFKLGSVFDKLNDNRNKKQNFKTMLSQYQDKPDIQGKLEQAFGKGYAAAESELGGKGVTTAKQGSAFAGTVRKFLWYALALWLIYNALQLFSMAGTNMRGLNILQQEKYEINPEEINVSFNDVKGVDEAKSELQDIVEYLKDPERFKTLGAKLPKGVLLVGQPGIGKTLLARAVAGEAGVPFFQCSGSEFDEMFVGTGAKRVRQLFGSAKLRAPCVIFIDEIDTLGAKRTSSQIHPYANQTINQLLAEMDGFQQNEGVIVLGATNRRDNLDKALLRPGRFDVEVRIFSPDLKGRKDIIELYLKKVTADSTCDCERLARGTTGFTGADIENMVNQAALKAAKDGSLAVSMADLEWARDKVLMGPAKKNRIPDEETNWMTAYHEAGHVLVAHYTKNSTPLHKVTIIPRGMSLGHTAYIPEKEQYNHSRTQLMAQMDTAMGGRVAEELIYGADKVTTGASSDFQSATGIATAMVRRFGMSDKVGVRVFSDDDGADGGLTMVKVNDVSPATQELIDSEIKRLLQESYERAKAILKAHSVEHKLLAQALMKYETLDVDEVKTIVEGRKLIKQPL